MSVRSTLARLPLLPLLVLLLILFAPGHALAKIDPPVVSSFQVLTSPTLGGQCAVIWAGIPEITPLSAALTFTLETPGGTVTSATQPLAMKRGQVADATFSFPTPASGTYRVIASLAMAVPNGRFAQASSLNVVVTAAGRSYLGREKVLSAGEYAARAYTKTPVITDTRAPKTFASPGFTMTGTYRYTDRTYDAGGFTGTRVLPIRRATVTIRESINGLSTTTLGTATTNDLGVYTFNVPPGNAAGGRDLTVTLSTEASFIRVQDLGGSPYPHTTRVVQWQGGPLNLGTTVMSQDQSAPWNIFDTFATGAEYVRTLTGAMPERVVCRWAVGNTEGTYYSPVINEIALLGQTSDDDSFDDAVILHEYGHFIAHHYGFDKSPGGSHTWTSHISPALAWSEGWATFISSAIRNSPIYFDSNLYGGMVLDIEIPTDNVSGDDNEGAVAASLWDIFDARNDGRDVLADGIANIWHVFTNFFTYRRACVMRDFYDGWVALGRARLPEVQGILYDHGIQYPQLVVTAMSINNGAETTVNPTVTLNNACVGSPVAYIASEDAGFTGGVWKPYTATPAFTLASGNGNRGVYFKVKDAAGNESAPIVDTIIIGHIPIQPIFVDGPRLQNTIDSEFDYDLYEFQLQTTTTCTIDTADVSIEDSVMELFGPNSQTRLLAANDDGHGEDDYMSRITMELGPGKYYVRISGFSTSTGDYQLWIYAGSPVPKIPVLAIDGPLQTGKIDTPNGVPENWFRFLVEKAGPYTIQTHEVSLYDSRIALYGPGSQTTLIEEDDDGGKTYMSMISRNLEPGLYYVKVKSYSPSINGSYAIRVYQGLQGSVKPLKTNGPAVTDQITSGTDFDWFSFAIDVPGNYAIETSAGTLTDSYLFLYGPNSQEAFYAEANNLPNNAGKMAVISRYLERGVYYCKVEGYLPSDIGSYAIRVRSDVQGTTVPINGSWVPGEISATARNNWFAFKVASPTGVFISTIANTLNDTVIYLYGPDDPTRLIAHNDDINSKNSMSSLTVWLAPGTYYLRVEAYSAATQSGSYFVRLAPIPHVPSIPLGIGAPPTPAAISFSADTDWYAFTVPTPGNYIVETLAGTLQADYMGIYGPGNQVNLVVLTGAADRMARRLVKLNPGTYYIKVQGYSPTTLGTYRIQVRPEVTRLTVNGAPLSRLIPTSRDSDWFSFTVARTGTITIETIAGTMTDSYLKLYGPNGRDALIAQDNDSGPGAMAALTRTLTPGTYYVHVKGAMPEDIGSYSIAVREKVTPLQLNAAWVSGAVASSGDVDWYSFTVASRGVVSIETIAGTLNSDYMRLYGPASRTALLAQDNHSGVNGMARITRTLNPGTYYVMITGNRAVNIGTYKIMVRTSVR